GWSHGGQRGAGAVALYKSGNKALAFWYLGHASHLLEDLSVPAHALLWPHPVRGVDAYETFIGKRVSGWPALDGEPVERFNTLYDLFLRTGQVSAGFDAGYGPGPMEGVDGTRDRGRRRAEGFPRPALLQEESVLIPLAIRRIAALFRLFYAQVDHAPPTVSLRVLRRGRRARLTALARDAQSGVDRRGFRFQYRLLGTRPWREASAGPTGPVRYLPLRPQAAYAFRVRAVDSVGNAAYSPIVVSLPRTRPALLAVR
ncbi:MAG: hypothetical protein KGK30_08845, partial [Elusimicrobia bacterium]|nr:hypothetical protein [Elusimicrobiota bacterium]